MKKEIIIKELGMLNMNFEKLHSKSFLKIMKFSEEKKFPKKSRICPKNKEKMI